MKCECIWAMNMQNCVGCPVHDPSLTGPKPEEPTVMTNNIYNDSLIEHAKFLLDRPDALVTGISTVSPDPLDIETYKTMKMTITLDIPVRKSGP